MDIRFSTYNDFLTEYQTYKLDKCSNCEGVRELIDDDVTVVIENRTLHFPELLVLCCNKCGDKCLPEYSKQIIDGAYKSMIEQEQFVGEFVSKSYKKKFEYCKETDYKYDHKDYYNIPGLCYDEEHSTEGFLTPVYFDRKALIYFISVPDFEVDIFSETYGHIGKALNIIQPDFIRVHATGIKPESKLGEFVRDGSFTLQSEEEIVIEQKLFLQQLHEMDSYYVNEHIVNLLLEVRGNLRTEKQEMLSTIDRFLTLPPDERLLFTVGRRLNIFFRLDDLKKPKLYQKAGESLQQILSKNPHVDFAALCNYVRQSQI